MRPEYEAETQVVVAYVSAPCVLCVRLSSGPIWPFLLNTPFFLFSFSSDYKLYYE